MSAVFFTLSQLSILAYALLGGVFLAFSDFIMRALAHTGGIGGVEAMQVINKEVFRWIFMTLFMGMAIVSIVVVGLGVTSMSGTARTLIVSAGLTYLVGCFAVTVFFNVPMNETLARMDLSAPATRTYWTDVYLPRWTAWNSLRAFACTLAAGLLLVGLLMARTPAA